MKNTKYFLIGLAVLPFLSGCGGEPEWVAIYEDCKEQITASTAEMNKATADADNSPEVKAMMESMGGMAINLGMTACEMIRSSCEDDPDGTTCQTIIEQSKRSQ
ncbi:MAG: hypothetical protein HKP55_08285 [Gammaproteobacteria bacterium]|nr:hypothetical protein [Gammaproteobacteria bacterium]